MQNRRTLLTLLLLCPVSVMLTAALWLCGPSNPKAWRINARVPVFGTVSFKVNPAIQLVTSAPVRWLLQDNQWHSRYGLVHLINRPDGWQINCNSCVFPLTLVSKKPVKLNKVNLGVQRVGQQISGTIFVNHNGQQIKLFYSGNLNDTGFEINWSFPSTPIHKLTTLLKNQSVVLQRSRVDGSFAATGTLRSPHLTWSVNPELESFKVSALGTERLKTADIAYRCATSKINPNPAAFAWLKDSQMGRWLPRAVIIAEDAHFREHPGYNLDAIRAILSQSRHGKALGGSTITQQLAKNFFTGGERTLLRKLEELLFAVEMENTLGKRRILNLYLNTVDLGPGICGIGQAAEVYFAKKPTQLTPVEAAWLASIINNPHRAWQQQYLLKTPDVNRLAWVMSYMPKRLRPVKNADVIFHASSH